jgi:hypothetical protein
MDKMTSQTLRALLRTCGGLLLVLASACASHGPEPQTLGFLENYEQLSPGREGQASLLGDPHQACRRLARISAPAGGHDTGTSDESR